jgi:hypothetical protein
LLSLFLKVSCRRCPVQIFPFKEIFMKKRVFGRPSGAAALAGVMLLCIALTGFMGCEKEPELSGENKITAFKIGESVGVINEVAQAISVTLPAGNALTGLTPEVTVSADATVTPAAGEVVDLSQPVSYTVTAENGVTRNYVVKAAAEAVLKEIHIQALPAKTIYVVGESFSAEGLIVVGLYSDGATREETAYYLTPLPVPTDGANDEVEVTVHVGDKTATFPVSVKTSALVSISASTVKTDYPYGEELDKATIVVTAAYSDGTTEIETTGFTVEGYDKDKSGPQAVLVTLNEKTTTVTVTVAELAPTPTLTSIAVTPLKTAYTQGDELDPAGIVVTGTYSDGSTHIEKENEQEEGAQADGYVVSGYEPEKPGTQTVLVTMEEKTATFTVTVSPPRGLTSLAVTALKTSYAYEEDIEPEDIVVTGTYSDGSTKREDKATGEAAGYELSGYNSEKPGTQTVLVTMEEKTATFTVTVAQPVTLTALSATTVKTNYGYGEELDTAKIVVTGNYSDGTTSILEPAEEGEETDEDTYELIGYESETPGSQTVYVRVRGKTASFNVTVGQPHNLTSIAATTWKANYAYDEAFDETTIEVTGTYSDGTTEIEDADDYEVTGYDSRKPGQQTLLVTLGDKTTTFTVTVARPVTLTALSATTVKPNYAYGEPLDETTIVVTGNYSDSTIETIDEDGYDLTGYDPQKSGSQTVYVRKDGKTATFNVTVGVKRDISVTVGLPNTNQEPAIFGIPEGGIQLSASKDGLPDKIVISAAANSQVYTSISWYVDGATYYDGGYSTTNANIITIDAANYTLKKHYLTFVGTKDGVEYSRTIEFTVVK